MVVDISFEYDACYEEFINNNVLNIINNADIWISYHTEVGKLFLEKYGWYGEINQRFKVSHDKGLQILKNSHAIKRLSKIYFGFYWLDIEHKKHIGE